MMQFVLPYRSFFLSIGIAFGLLVAVVNAAEQFETLQVGDSEFHNVFVKEVNSSAIIIRHSKGIAQLELKDLSSELQAQFDYNEVADLKRRDEIASQTIARLERQAEVRSRQETQRTKTVQQSSGLMNRFGSIPEIRANVDYRPIYSKLELGTRNQGSRPSCSVFAMVSAIEFLQARKTGKTEKFSEEYLIWAVLKSLGKSSDGIDQIRASGMDAGFSLFEVAQALRAYGIPLRSQMPYSLREGISSRNEPDQVLIQDAQQRSNISAYMIPGRTNDVRLANIIHSLNENTPIVIGLAWPSYHTLANTALLSKQKPRPGAGHAVTLVGYRSETGKMEDTSFIFRNSWGRNWGAGGYGIIRYEYLVQHLRNAIFIEL